MLEAASCDELNACMSPRRPEQTWLSFTPGDLWTDAGEQPWVVSLEHAGSLAVSASALSEVSASVSIERLDGTRVPGVTAEVVVDSGAPERAQVDVLSAEPLADGWYVLSAVMPSGVEAHPSASLLVAGDGRASVRVHVGSRPLLLQVQVCDATSPGDTVVLWLSEAIEGAASLEVSGLGGGTCSLRTAAPAEASLRLSCDADMRDRVRVAFTEELASTDGAALEAVGATTDGPTSTLTLDRADLVPTGGSGCSAWVLPAPEHAPVAP